MTGPAGRLAWPTLVLAGLFEVGFTTSMAMTRDDPRWWWPLLVCVIASFELLKRAISHMPMGVAYAVWTGIGAVGTALVGMAAFGESTSPVRLALLGVLVGALVGLKLVTGRGRVPEEPAGG